MENEAEIPLDSFSCKDTSFRMNHQMGWLTVLVPPLFHATTSYFLGGA